MSKPTTSHRDPIMGALTEVSRAMAALNMPEQEAYPGSKVIVPDEIRYLSETDHWAKHAMEHLLAAMQLLSRAQIYYETLKEKVRESD